MPLLVWTTWLWPPAPLGLVLVVFRCTAPASCFISNSTLLSLAFGATSASHVVKAREAFPVQQSGRFQHPSSITRPNAGALTKIRIQLDSPPRPELRAWLKRALPALAEAVIELGRAGRSVDEQELVPLFVPEHTLTVEDVRQAARAAALRRAIYAGTEWATARQIAELANLNSGRQASRWKRQKRIFAIRHRGRDYFPKYGFEPPDFYPVEAMAEVIKALSGYSGDELAAWFESPSDFLRGKRPRELVGIKPMRVLAAARATVESRRA